jgi:hypothetical protein
LLMTEYNYNVSSMEEVILFLNQLYAYRGDVIKIETYTSEFSLTKRYYIQYMCSRKITLGEWRQNG